MRFKLPTVGKVLKTAGSHPEDDKTNSEATQRAAGMDKNRRKCSNDNDDMSNQCKGKGNLDGLQSSPELICNPGTENGQQVGPEGVD